MSALTAGNWIAYQNPSQVQYGHWSVGIENQYGIHGVGSGEHRDVSFDVQGICTEADAKAMAASKEMLEALKAVLPLVEHLQAHPDDTLDAEQQDSLDKARAVLAKAGAQ